MDIDIDLKGIEAFISLQQLKCIEVVLNSQNERVVTRGNPKTTLLIRPCFQKFSYIKPLLNYLFNCTYYIPTVSKMNMSSQSIYNVYENEYHWY